MSSSLFSGIVLDSSWVLNNAFWQLFSHLYSETCHKHPNCKFTCPVCEQINVYVLHDASLVMYAICAPFLCLGKKLNAVSHICSYQVWILYWELNIKNIFIYWWNILTYIFYKWKIYESIIPLSSKKPGFNWWPCLGEWRKWRVVGPVSSHCFTHLRRSNGVHSYTMVFTRSYLLQWATLLEQG